MSYIFTRSQLDAAFMRYLKQTIETPGKTVVTRYKGKPISHAARDEAGKLLYFLHDAENAPSPESSKSTE